MDLTDIFRTFNSNAEEYTFFSSAHGTFSRIDHIMGHNQATDCGLGHNSSLNKFKKTEIISSIFSDHKISITRKKTVKKKTQTDGD